MSKNITLSIATASTKWAKTGDWYGRDQHSVTATLDSGVFTNGNTHRITFKKCDHYTDDPIYSQTFEGDGTASVEFTVNLAVTAMLALLERVPRVALNVEIRDEDADVTLASVTDYVYAPVNREDDVVPATVPDATSAVTYSVLHKAVSGVAQWVGRDTWLGTLLTALRGLGTGDSGQVLKSTGSAVEWGSDTTAAHDMGGDKHTAATLANLNTKISDATLIDTGDSRLSDARTPTEHGNDKHIVSYVASTEKGAANGVTPLGADSKIAQSYIPAVAIVSVHEVADETAQLALTAQEGDVACRTDINRTYMHNGGTAGTMADWTLLKTPTDAVLSVAGETGAITKTDLLTALNVEDGATADQTDEEIETAYNNQVPAASQNEAETGTEPAVRRFSPERIGQAIRAIAPVQIDGGRADTNYTSTTSIDGGTA